MKDKESLCERDNTSGYCRKILFICHFLEFHPEFKCLSYQSLHRILIQKDKTLQAHVITTLSDMIKNPKISDYRVQKIIAEQREIINK